MKLLSELIIQAYFALFIGMQTRSGHDFARVMRRTMGLIFNAPLLCASFEHDKDIITIYIDYW